MIFKIKNLRFQPMFRLYDFYVGLYVDTKDWQFYFVFFGLVLKVWREVPVVGAEKINALLMKNMRIVSHEPVFDDDGDLIGMSIAYEPKRMPNEFP